MVAHLDMMMPAFDGVTASGLPEHYWGIL